MSIASEIERLQLSKSSIKTSIENKGVSVPSSATLDEYSSYIDQISQGGVVLEDVWEGVNFLDYDGTTVEVWPAADVASKTVLPTPPTHNGLTFNGWNWTLVQIKTYISSYPDTCLYIGPKYITTDGFTHIFIRLEESNLSPYLNFRYRATGGTAAIDWGDNTTTSLANASSYTLISQQHIYSLPGDYEIKIKNVTHFLSYGNAAGSTLLSASPWTTSVTAFRDEDQVYMSAIKGMWLQSNSYGYAQSYMIRNAKNCEYFLSDNPVTTGSGHFLGAGIKRLACFPNSTGTISLQNAIKTTIVACPYGNTTIGNSTFSGSGLQVFAIPDTVTTLGTQVFMNNTYLQKITIPSSITTINTSDFSGCSSLNSITLPSTITSIAATAFQNCYGLSYILFRPTTPPTVANANAFTGIPTTCLICIPVSKVTNYQTATNYPSSPTYTYIGWADGNDYATGTTLPTVITGWVYSLTWYNSISDLKANINPITISTGKMMYCKQG